MASRMYSTRVKHTPSGPLYIAHGANWGPIQSSAPIDVVYFVWPSGGHARTVCTTLAAATYEAAWAWWREGVPNVSIVRSDGVEVREDCDACGSQEEAIRIPSSPEIREYLCKDCWETQLLGCAVELLCQPAKRGRPEGSGTFPTANDFLQAIRPILQALRHEGTYPSQAEVVQRLPIRTTTRQLRQWLDHFKISWDDLRNTR